MNILKNIKSALILHVVCIAVFMLSMANIAFALPGYGIGGLAEEAVEGPITILLHFVDDTCYVLGIGLVLVGISKYFTHRKNPQMVTLSTVITYIILGLVTFALPFVLYLMSAPTNLTPLS